MNKKGYSEIGEFAYVTDGIHTSIDYSEDSGINLFSATTPRENYFDLSRGAYISEKAHKANPRTSLQENDIIISTVGTIGNCAVVNKDVLPANSDRHVGIIRVKNDTFYPRFVSTFLLTKYGRFQTLRESTGNVQLNLFLYKIRELKIPNVSKEFQEKIENLVIDSDIKIKTSKEKYTQAENMLLSEIGLEDFHPSSEKVSIKTLKESFLKTGRLDSEYYQVKYDDYLDKIYNYQGGYELLEKCCKLKDKNFKPNDEVKYKYIELANVRGNAEIVDYGTMLGKDLPTRARRRVNIGDVIISGVEGSLESCALITKEFDNSLCSTGFYVINSDKLNSETLLTVFKSSLMFNLMKKGCSGTILTNIAKDEFVQLPIPLIKKAVQDEIASYIQKSQEYSKKAKELLQNSVKAVEIAIDKDEETAQNFLAEQSRAEQSRAEQSLIDYCNKMSIYYYRLAVFTLYEEIGLFDDIKIKNYTVKNLSDTFAVSGRLDSEYYQEKYDRLFKKLSHFKAEKLSDLVSIKKSIEPGSESYQNNGIPFVRVQDLSKFEISKPSVYLDDEKFGNAIKPKKDTILFSKDGTVGIAYKMNDCKNIITSSAILHLNVNNTSVLPDYLTLVLNSIVVKMQAEKDAGGSIIKHWKKSEIENVIIPIIFKEKQEEIAELLVESEEQRIESKKMLNKAVKAIEIAIEQGEGKALNYLKLC